MIGLILIVSGVVILGLLWLYMEQTFGEATPGCAIESPRIERRLGDRRGSPPPVPYRGKERRSGVDRRVGR